MAGRPRATTATMADVAHAAGVSITTVSHVMNRTRRVSPASAAMVLQAATEVGYVRDDLHPTGRGAGLKTIGLAMSAITNPYFGTVVQSVEATLAAAGYLPILADTHDEPVREIQAVAQLLSKRVDGLILAPADDANRVLGYAEKQDVPIVIIDRAVDARVDQIAAENVEPTARLIDHLAHLGHHRIAMIAGRPEVRTRIEREQGFRLGLRRNKLRFTRSMLEEGESTSEGAAAAFGRLMDLPVRPTALFVANNSMTMGVLRAASGRKIKIPRDLALVCFDDFEWGDLFSPGLTAIAQPVRDLGAQAAQLILTRLAAPDLPARALRLESVLVHRESCGCSAGAPIVTDDSLRSP